MKYNLLIDLDDTLIPNAYTYFQPQMDMAGLIIWDLTYHSPNPVTIINRATEIQVAEIARTGFISKYNFPLSYVTAYSELCEKVGRQANDKIKSAIFISGIKYFRENYELYPGVLETLQKLAVTHKCIIVTRGDVKIQQYKIDNIQIEKYFEHVEIVDIKNKQTYLNIIEKYHLDPNKTLMVGDSLRNDIIPALEAGLQVIQICAEDATDWEKSLGIIEVDPDFKRRFHSAKNFTEIIDYIDKIFVPNPIGC